MAKINSLSLSESIYKEIIETTRDGFFLTDKRGYLLDANTAACDLLGYSRAELLRLKIADIDANETPEQTIAHIKNIINNGHGRFNTRHRRKDGTLIDVEVVTHYINDVEIGYFVCFIRDLSFQKELYNQLRAERDLSQHYLDVASTIFVVLQANQEVEVINRKGCEVLGYDREEIIGQNWFDLVIPVSEIDEVKKVFSQLIKGQAKTVEYYENHIVAKSGKKHLIAWSNNLIYDANGKVSRIIGCGQDITAQRQTEDKIIEEKNKLESVMAALDDGITVQDRNFNILYQNDQHKAMQGGHLGERCYAAYQNKADICQGCLLVKSFADGQIHRREVVAEGKNGDRLYLEVSASPVRNAEGEIIAGIEAVRNISDRKKLEYDAQRARNLESLGVFAGGIAHDFNNLLTAIMGNLSLLRLESTSTPTIDEVFDAMEEACSRAKKLTQQLLTFSKGGAPLVEVSSLEEIANNSTGFILRGSKIKLISKFPKDLWPVEVDNGQISQVMQNLAKNSSQAMPNGGIIEMTAENINIDSQFELPLAAGRYIKLTFKDNGCGIAPEYLAKIFDPYFSTKPSGSGLGLAISFSIIKKHGGHIEAFSTPGMGTLFNIWLPAASTDHAASAPEAQQLTTINQGQGKILVMDDDEMLRNMAKKMLAKLGYNVEVATDGQDMLNTYEASYKAGTPFDAVIMDLTIPGGMGGSEAIGQLLKLDPKAKAIVSSGYSNDPVISQYTKYGFQGVLEKPFCAKDLSAILNSLI